MVTEYLLFRKLKRKQSKYRHNKGLAFSNVFKVTALSLVLIFSFSIFAFFLFHKTVLGAYDKHFSKPSLMLALKSNSITFLDRNGKVIYRTPGRYNTKIVPIEEMSPHLINATLSAEDKNFYKHDGFSLISTTRALINDIKELDIYYQGGSTITQQLARTFFLNHDKSFWRKLREVVLAFEIERRYSKKDILELYLNSIYYGSGAYGAPEAAKIYFGKDVKDLNLSESALLAGLPVSPTTLSPINGKKDLAFARQKYVLKMMAKNGFIKESEVKAALETELKINETLPSTTNAPHFVLYVKRVLKEKFPDIELDTSGLVVHTTLDLDLQKKAESLVAERVKALTHRNVSNGAFYAANPKTGEILTMVGSVNFNQEGWGTVNILTSPRSPGSAIKPIIYAIALDSGSINPATVLDDKPTEYKNEWETYKPTNSDGKFRGKILPRIALANSLNVPAVEVIARTGLSTALEGTKRLGIEGLGDPNNYGLSFALGGLELRGIDLATAYGALANGGYLIKPWGISKVEDRFGETLFETEIKKEQVLDARIAYLITNILSDLEARRMLFGRPNPLELDRPAAAKTGTGQDFKNTWTVGYVPSLLALSWFGNNNGSPMREIWGLESAAVVWNQYMRFALQNSPKENFQIPSGIRMASVCALDGSKSVEGQPSISELFIEGSEPTQPGACALAKRQEEQRLAIEEAVRKTVEGFKKKLNEEGGRSGPLDFIDTMSLRQRERPERIRNDDG